MTISRIHHSARAACRIVGPSLLPLASTGSAVAQPGWVLSHQKISSAEGDGKTWLARNVA